RDTALVQHGFLRFSSSSAERAPSGKGRRVWFSLLDSPPREAPSIPTTDHFFQSWRDLLLCLKRRGLAMAPELAVADGALGFWQAVEEVWPKTRGQRCWVHKTANVLNKLPKSQQSKAKRAIQEIWMAQTKKDALLAFDSFVETW